MPDITAQITFLPKGRNVRAGPIVGRSLGCAVVIDGTQYDIRFELVPGQSIQLGSTAVLDGTFDEPDAVMQLLKVGTSFTLWERGAMGQGVILKVHAVR